VCMRGGGLQWVAIFSLSFDPGIDLFCSESVRGFACFLVDARIYSLPSFLASSKKAKE